MAVRSGVHAAVLNNIRFEVPERYTLKKIVGKGSYGAVACVPCCCCQCRVVCLNAVRAVWSSRIL